MQKVSIRDLKGSAKQRLSGNWGNGILITLVPLFIGMGVTFFTSLMFGNFYLFNMLVSLLVSTTVAFMSLNLLLPFVKGSNYVDFGSSLSPGNKLGKFIMYALGIAVVTFIVQIPLNLLFFNSVFTSESDIYVRVELYSEFSDMMDYLLLTMTAYVSLAILISLITVPLFFTRFLLVDEDISIIEAIKKSIKLSKGNYFRIILIQLSFIGWFLTLPLTFFLSAFYIVPYMQVTLANFYLAVREENGETFINENEPRYIEKADDWLEEKNEDTTTTSEWDF